MLLGMMFTLSYNPTTKNPLLNDSAKKKIRFYWRFQIVEKIGKVAYKLSSPPTNIVHPVIYVSQFSSWNNFSITNSTLTTKSRHGYGGSTSRNSRTQKKGWHSKHVEEVLIKWQRLSITEATWEDYQNINIYN